MAIEGGSSHIDRCLGRVGAAANEPEADFIERADDRMEDASSAVCAGAVDLRRSVKRPALGVASSGQEAPAALELSVPTEEKLPFRLGLLGGLSSGFGALLEPEEKTLPRPSPKALLLRALPLPLTLPALIELTRLRSTSNE